MHILFITDNFPPEVNAPASRTFEHAKEWVKLGQKVTVITCAPNFPKGKVFNGYKNKIWQIEHIEGIRVVRVWSYITANEGFSKRVFDYLSFMISSFFAAFFVRRVDIIVGTSPQFFTAVSAWAVAAMKRRPFIFELRDLWPDSIRAVGAMKGSRVLYWLEKLEIFLYHRATGIVSVTESFRANLIARGIDQNKIVVVTNGVDSSKFQPTKKDHKLARKLGIKGQFVIGYIGTHGMAHGLGTLIDAAASIETSYEHKDIYFLFLGDGAEKTMLESRAKELNLVNIKFIGTVPKEQVSRYWSLLDVSIVHLRKTDLFKTVIPSKIFECMGMGIPILHGVEGESADIVSKHQVGLTFGPEDKVDLIKKIIMLRENTELLDRLSTNGPIAAQFFDRNELASHMLNCLKSWSNVDQCPKNEYKS